MPFVFHRRVALPLWPMVFFMVAVAASPSATPLLVAVVGIAAIAWTAAGLVPRLRRARSAVVASHRRRHNRSAALSTAGGACVRTPDEPYGRSTAQDALDLVRMDDDGGWQMAPPPA
jgi:hypothetical protein